MAKASKESKMYHEAQANANRNYNLRKIKEPDELVRLFEEYLETCTDTIVKNNQPIKIKTIATKAGFFRHLVKLYGWKPQSTKRWFRELPADFADAKDYIHESLEEHNTISAGKGDVVAQVFTSFAKAKYEDYRDNKLIEIKSSSEKAMADMTIEELQNKFNEIARLETTEED